MAGSACHSSGRPRVCISTTPQPAAAQTWAIASIPQEAADIVNDLGSGMECGRGGLRIYRYRWRELTPDDGAARLPAPERHGRSPPGCPPARAFPAGWIRRPISTMSAPSSNIARACSMAAAWRGEGAAIGKGVRRGVQHPHHQGPLPQRQGLGAQLPVAAGHARQRASLPF